ncbi:MAG TPA: sulfur carrier protein ThiS adenylyltransferase ThiF [Chitinispirillaceae bacterium]|nr:sulfur carrier protein ThiS adenylyltransferase ThiF [Chitinispirillaceae bacterium]
MKTFSFSEVSSFFYSAEQINLIKNTRIGIAGAGGLGSNCAHILVRCGFDKLRIADFDTVSLSNLNRQIYRPSDLGKIKVTCLAEILTEINPQVELETFDERIDRTNIHRIFDCCDVLVEAFDNPECKTMLMEEFWESGKLIVAASGIGGFGSTDNLLTRKIKDNIYIIGDESSEVNDLVKPFAPSVMIAAAKQADIILNHFLNHSCIGNNINSNCNS